MIVVDIDGVVANSEGLLVRYIERNSGLKIKHKSPREFRFNIDIPDNDIVELIDECLINEWQLIEPHDEEMDAEALYILEERDGVVNFLTARSGGLVETYTHRWLNKFFPNLNYILHSLGDVDGSDKPQWMWHHGFNSIIEDRFKTANAVNFIGGQTYLINRPWNEGRQELPHVRRVRDLWEAVDHYVHI